MSDDGRPKFYKFLDVDDKTRKILFMFRHLKMLMLTDQDDYINGRTSIEKD